MKKFTFFMLGVSIFIAGIISWFASPSPDGLERVAENKGFIDAVSAPMFSILPDYTIPGIGGFFSGGLAGIIGVLATFGFIVLIGRLISKAK